jgi:hypothetical protein
MESKYLVQPIPTKRLKEWILKKHYAKRMPSISIAFGLYKKLDTGHDLIGGATFGITPVHFSNTNNIQIMEFNRLVVEEPHERNLLSFFIGRIIHMFPIRPILLVSYADLNLNHHGYIYQATNWIYTGETNSTNGKGMYLLQDGTKIHSKSIYNKYKTNSVAKLKEQGIEVTKSQDDSLCKYRYFLPIGTKKEKKIMIDWLKQKYSFLPYPKGNNKNYDASYKPNPKIGFGFF